MSKESEVPFEKAMARLEEIVAALEKGETTLEASLQMFEEGVALGKRCRTMLDRADTRVRKLIDVNEDGDVVVEDMDDEP